MGKIAGTLLLKADPETLRAIAECNERMARLCMVREKAEKGREFTDGLPNRISLGAADYTRLTEQRDRAVDLLRLARSTLVEFVPANASELPARVVDQISEYLRETIP